MTSPAGEVLNNLRRKFVESENKVKNLGHMLNTRGLSPEVRKDVLENQKHLSKFIAMKAEALGSLAELTYTGSLTPRREYEALNNVIRLNNKIAKVVRMSEEAGSSGRFEWPNDTSRRVRHHTGRGAPDRW